MTIKTSGELVLEIATNFADNTTGDISAADARNMFTNMVDSVAPQDIHTGGTSGAIVIDLNRSVQKINLAGNVTGMTTINRDADLSKSVKVRVSGDGSPRGLVFSDSWQWLGTKPSGTLANEVAFLSITSFGPTESEIIAAYEVAGSGA